MFNAKSPLELLIGVTGHRDIPASEIPKVLKSLISYFLRLKQTYPHTNICIVTGLAEGADQVAATAATAAGLKYCAVLPMPLAEYQKDFTSPATLEKFREYMQGALDTVTCHPKRDGGYAALGKYLVRHCHVVIAVWDGVMSQKNIHGELQILPGGTADVVRMCKDGYEEPERFELATPGKTFCWQLVVNRVRNETNPELWHAASHIGHLQLPEGFSTADQKAFEQLCLQTDRFNCHSSQITNAQRQQSKHWLLADTQIDPTDKALTQAIETYAIADQLAQLRQRQRNRAILLISLTSFIAVACQQIYSEMWSHVLWFAMHLTAIGVSYGFYQIFFGKTDQREEQFLQWRALAEGLRVQIFWCLSGMNDSVADYYRSTKLGELQWLVCSIRCLQRQPYQSRPPSSAVVVEQWLRDQQSFFIGRTNKSAYLSKLHQQKQNISRSCLLTGVVLMCLSYISTLTPTLATYKPVIILLASLIFVIAALYAAFNKQMGYQEVSLRYRRAGYFYNRAIEAINHDGHSEFNPKQLEVIKAIGVEALNENVGWLQLHQMNKYEFKLS